MRPDVGSSWGRGARRGREGMSIKKEVASLFFKGKRDICKLFFFRERKKTPLFLWFFFVYQRHPTKTQTHNRPPLLCVRMCVDTYNVPATKKKKKKGWLEIQSPLVTVYLKKKTNKKRGFTGFACIFCVLLFFSRPSLRKEGGEMADLLKNKKGFVLLTHFAPYQLRTLIHNP